MTHQSSLFLRVSLLIAFALFMVWQVVTRSFSAYLAVETPETALRLRSTEPTALLGPAENRLNLVQTNSAAEPASFPHQAKDANADANLDSGDPVGQWAAPALEDIIENLLLDQGGQADVMPNRSERSRPPLSVSQIEWIQNRAELALLYDPLNARALRILGQLADRAGDYARASKLMKAAAHRSLSQSIAVYWLAQRGFQEQEYPTALYFADALLRKRPQVLNYAMPILVRIAESADENARDELRKLIAKNPPWRSAFFSALPRVISDARTPLDLFLSIKETPTPPTSVDLSTYLNLLVERKLYELAYYTWLQFLPPEQLSSIGLMANSSFEENPSGLPFDWIISPGAGVTIDIAARPEQDGKRALLLQFGPGRANFRGVSQLLMLPPGFYQFKGMYKGELKGLRGLQWGIACTGEKGASIGQGDMFVGSATTWQELEFKFTVPDAECRAQYLRLTLAARSASERLVSGAVWYDELGINRIEQPDQTRETEGATSRNHANP